MMAILKISLAATLALVFLSFANLADSRHVLVACSGDRPTTTDTSVRLTSESASPLVNDIYDYSGVGGIDQEALIFAPGSSSSSSSDSYSGSDSDSNWTTRVLGRHTQRNTDLINIVERVLGPDRPKLPTEKRASRTRRAPANTRPTPEPTGPSSRSTTVHIRDERDFALLLPDRADELISDAESDGVSFCTPESTDETCERRVREGFIRATAIAKSADGTYIQITGCLDSSKSSLDPTDSGGQFDVRFPNGAQCTFGGYGASFIQLIEPAANRFCLRCCSGHDDQESCNSHQDTAGCPAAIPGTYSFPELGIDCDE
ncbi:hypothetical protein C8Q74DRAFT_249760 [Fomes fomentarius]|nr:hypothetical protein C8Q74DRAFT_249760 [Fomes fomentarius]